MPSARKLQLRKNSAVCSRVADAASDGLPAFCKARHFVKASQVFAVPFWELPPDDDWVAEEVQLQSRSHLASGTEVPVGIGSRPDLDDAEGVREETCESDHDDDQYDDWESQEDDVENDTCEGMDVSSGSRVWSQGLFEKLSVLVRRVPRRVQFEDSASSHSDQFYGLAVSAALLPRGILRQEPDSVLDNNLGGLLKLRRPRWAILALRSGYFAGAVFDGPEVVVHKTLHRYTCRAKQGGSQSSYDASGNGKNAKSAGANLRRNGEKRLGEDVCDLISVQWATHLASCDIVFISASTKTRSVLVGRKDSPYVPLEKVRILTSMHGRPSFEAVRDAYMQLATVKFCNDSSHFFDVYMRRAATRGSSSRRAESAVAQEGGDDILDTPLHSAAFAGDSDRILELLEAGADPTVSDAQGRVPFDLCSARHWHARQAFVFWRGQREDAWDWSAARIQESGNSTDVKVSQTCADEDRRRHKSRRAQVKKVDASSDDMKAPQLQPNSGGASEHSSDTPDRKGKCRLHASNFAHSRRAQGGQQTNVRTTAPTRQRKNLADASPPLNSGLNHRAPVHRSMTR